MSRVASLPTPFKLGSTMPSTAWPATMASKAFPPDWSTCSAVRVARGAIEATAYSVPRASCFMVWVCALRDATATRDNAKVILRVILPPLTRLVSQTAALGPSEANRSRVIWLYGDGADSNTRGEDRRILPAQRHAEALFFWLGAHRSLFGRERRRHPGV